MWIFKTPYIFRTLLKKFENPEKSVLPSINGYKIFQMSKMPIRNKSNKFKTHEILKLL